MQLLRKIRSSWDEPVPLEIYSLWSAYQDQLPLIEYIRFTRLITVSNSNNSQLHGFYDFLMPVRRHMEPVSIIVQ